jgi:hypothetical protein
MIFAKLREEESQSCRDIAEGERFGDVHEVAQSLAKLADHRVSDLRAAPIECLELGAGNEEEARFDVRYGRCRVRAAVDQGQLSDRLAWTLAVQNLFAPGRARPIYPHPTRYDDVEAVAGLSGGEKNMSRGVWTRYGVFCQAEESRFAEPGKKRYSAK